MNIHTNQQFLLKVYYAISIAAFRIASGALSFYWTFVVMAMIEIPFDFAMISLLLRYGRKILLVIFLVLASISCVLAVVTGKWPLVMALSSFMAKGFIAGTFTLAYVYTLELIPTMVRTFGLGATSGFARIAVILSPFLSKYVSRLL